VRGARVKAGGFIFLFFCRCWAPLSWVERRTKEEMTAPTTPPHTHTAPVWGDPHTEARSAHTRSAAVPTCGAKCWRAIAS
jgi:hypothetical protein